MEGEPFIQANLIYILEPSYSMAISAYVFIRTSPGKARDVAKAISGIGGVKSAHAVTGRFDVIAFVEAPDIAALGDLVLSKIHGVEGVLSSETSIVV